MKILAVADYESPALWDYYTPDKLEGVDLILSCGDLKSHYLSFLATFAHCPVLYVHGNHDGHYEKDPPLGCTCIDGQCYEYQGLRIVGLGGSMRYKKGPHQYTDRQMRWRLWKQELAIRRAGGVDILLTHAPPRGYGDREDYAHRGFEAFLPFLDRHKPAYLVHGHVHMNYGHNIPRAVKRGDTTIINAWERYILEL